MKELDGSKLLEKGTDHAWAWFSLHANQRMQAFNYFLVAAAFITASFVASLREGLFLVGTGVAILGLILSCGFLQLEARTRELVRAGEAALRPLQSRLAQVLQIGELEIVKSVETPSHPLTAYSFVIKSVESMSAVGFALGAIYALIRWFMPS